LKANKDPLTILAGFERVLDELPRARLYMAYREADLLPAVQGRLAASPKLAAAVTLLGTIPADKMESYYNSADLFVQGSYREGSGLAVLEALACGAIPVVTDIPAFRALTAGGQVGALFPPGEAHAFAEAFLRLAGRERQTEAQAARQLFERRWSYRQVGRSACTAYEQIYQRKTGRGLR
jgi:glycosyltransferase involved in cell wall biosynthesis